MKLFGMLCKSSMCMFHLLLRNGSEFQQRWNFPNCIGNGMLFISKIKNLYRFTVVDIGESCLHGRSHKHSCVLGIVI